MKEISNRYGKEALDEVLDLAKYSVGECDNSIPLPKHVYKKSLKHTKELMKEYGFGVAYEEIRREFLSFYRR